MDLAECMARALAVEGACLAADRHSTPPPGRLRETWPDYHREACAILVDLGPDDIWTSGMAGEIETARSQLLRYPARPTPLRLADSD